jgi:AraC-like DNA-binding protein
LTAHRRIVLTASGEQPLPLYIEAIGHNHDQEPIVRPHGYPLYHWIQTAEGEGVLSFEGKQTALPPGSGFLLLPNDPHEYKATGGRWGTLYLTFGGPAADSLADMLGLRQSGLFRWESDTPLASLVGSLLDRFEGEPDLFGLQASTEVYRFLITLHKYGQRHGQAVVSRNLHKLRPLIEWMEARYPDPGVGLEEMARTVDVSVRQLNDLFRETFGVSPYAYFLNLRIRKAKELLIGRRDAPVKHISRQCGFRDVSHFIATFRKSVGLSPERFRKLY